VRVFELNNSIIRSLPVGPRQTWQAVVRVLPPEVVLCVCACIFAVFMMVVTNLFLKWVETVEPGRDFEDSVGDLEGHPLDPGRQEL
jgi:hypothetical protein